jgi:Spy/CpxP family protein refolding chaperone
MRKLRHLLFAAGCLALAAAATAQPPGGRPPDQGKARPKDGDGKSLVERMMAFDKNKDGKLTRDEITDPRLLRLFDQADTNKDGVVTREELEAFAAKQAAQGGGRDGPGGPGGPGGRGRGGRGGFGGLPQPGQVLPPFLQDMLRLSDAQKKQVDELQKDVDGKLAKILTDEQKKQLQEMRQGFGRGGRGGPGGRGPGGPPGGEGGRPGGPPQ